MVHIRSQREVSKISRSCQIVADTLIMLKPHVIPGARVFELDKMAENFIRSIGNFSEIDRNSIEFRKYVFIFLTQLRMWENELYQYRQGLFDSEEFESRLNLWATTINSEFPTGEARRQIWEVQIPNFSIDFVEVIDSLLARPEAD